MLKYTLRAIHKTLKTRHYKALDECAIGMAGRDVRRGAPANECATQRMTARPIQERRAQRVRHRQRQSSMSTCVYLRACAPALPSKRHCGLRHCFRLGTRPSARMVDRIVMMGCLAMVESDACNTAECHAPPISQMRPEACARRAVCRCEPVGRTCAFCA